jgi:hypothetical protein
VPLSEEELRLLEQMERALVEEDPKFASTLRGTSFRRAARRRAVVAGVVFVGGVALLMTGAIMAEVIVGVAGFVVMLASATYALASLRGHAAPAAGSAEVRPTAGDHGFGVIDGGRLHKPHRPRRQRQSSHGSFMDRMEERWRRRREQGF